MKRARTVRRKMKMKNLCIDDLLLSIGSTRHSHVNLHSYQTDLGEDASQGKCNASRPYIKIVQFKLYAFKNFVNSYSKHV